MWQDQFPYGVTGLSAYTSASLPQAVNAAQIDTIRRINDQMSESLLSIKNDTYLIKDECLTIK